MNTHTVTDGVDARQLFAALNTHASNSLAAGATTYYDLIYYKHVAFVITLTATNGDKISRVRVLQATASDGTGAKEISGRTYDPTTVDAAGETLRVEVNADELDMANGYAYVNVEVTSGGGTSSTTSCFMLRTQPRYAMMTRSAYTVRLPEDLAAAS